MSFSTESSSRSGKRRVRKRSRSSRPPRKQNKYVYPVVAGVTAAVAVGVSAAFFFLNKPAPPRPVMPGTPAAAVQEEAAPVWVGPQPEEVARRFLDADSHEKRLEWVRHPEKVADMMAAFYNEGRGKTEKVAKVSEAWGRGNDAAIFSTFDVVMTDSSQRTLYVPFDEGGAKVDFKAYVRHCGVPWSSLLEGKVTEAPEMRLFLEKSDYYNRAFADESVWQAFQGTSPDMADPIFLYVKRSDPAMARFLKVIPQSPRPYTVDITTSEDPDHTHRQFMISRMVLPDWVEP